MIRVPSAVDVGINNDPNVLSKLVYPVYASPKIDGIRTYVDDYTLYSKHNKPIPNFACQEDLNFINGLDCELVVGEPNAPGCINRTSSGVRSFEGNPMARLFAFDYFYGNCRNLPYSKRLDELKKVCDKYKGDRIVLLEQRLMTSPEDVMAYEDEVVSDGYEGVILRSPHGKYVTAPLKALLYKMKRFKDTEVVVKGFVEAMVNNNPQKLTELGTMGRSKSRELLFPGGTLGGLLVDWYDTQITVGCGTLTANERLDIFLNQSAYLGKTFTMRYMRYGMLTDSSPPRMAVFHTWRDKYV